ncbi:cNMP-binding protein [Legionella nautarum]|uniref:cNMP-binding protein n=1 Tax=Legionella nautarum TaxID=45070 RepID=A0A0W0X1W5_9GAMM|nr:cyclic nucleotide-binding domain-containing protein [Legionella nautarum]KTD38516.1 cNMP-binding protein [Legionella nautarum]
MSEFTNEEKDLLKNCELLKNLSDSEFQDFLAISSRASYGKDEVLLTEGEICEYFFIIISGTIEVSKNDPKSYKPLLISKLNGGQTIGEMRIIQNKACILTATASEPTVVLRTSITKLHLPENTHCYRAILESTIKIVSDRLLYSNETVLNKTAERRRKQKQLILAIFGIITLGLFLGEIALALYYALNASDFCKRAHVFPSHESLIY